MCFKVPGQSWFCVSVFFCFFSPFCADASCQAEIIDFWGDIKSWKSLAGPFGGQRLNSPSSPLWQICISGVGDTLSAVFFPPFFFLLKLSRVIARSHWRLLTHMCVCDKDKNEKCSLLSTLFFFLGPVSLLLRRWCSSCNGFSHRHVDTSAATEEVLGHWAKI